MLLVSFGSAVTLSHRIAREREGHGGTLTHGHDVPVALSLRSLNVLARDRHPCNGVLVGSEAWVFQYGSHTTTNRNSHLGIFFLELEPRVEILGAHLYLRKVGGA